MSRQPPPYAEPRGEAGGPDEEPAEAGHFGTSFPIAARASCIRCPAFRAGLAPGLGHALPARYRSIVSCTDRYTTTPGR